MVGPDDRDRTLDYARPPVDRSTPIRVDGAVGLMAGLQLILAGVILIVSLVPGSGNPGPPWSAIGAVAVYAALSAVALVGCVRPTVRQRRSSYLAYLIALPVITTLLSVASMFDGGLDRDTWWQVPLLIAIVNPAWLLLIVGHVRAWLA